MVVKILKPTAKFSGVMYSQRKVNEGKASFSGAFNFPFNENNASHETYIAYLERLANCADRNIKNRQFHAIISAKGKEYDEQFMVHLAEKWMHKMGYGEQPFLIYFHGDTANNHIHIVSCRINKDGKRINPYNEGIRAVKCMNELMNENLKEQAAYDINDAIVNYSFSTAAQFKLILEKRGWRIREKSGHILLFKNEICGGVEIEKVTEKARNYQQDKARIKQLRAIFHKYSGLQTEQFQAFMRTNLGVEIVFHTSKGHIRPYGYSVIDHHKKCVMKGGEILPVESLLSPKSREEHLNIVSDLLQSRSQYFSDLRATLSTNGYYLKKDEIYLKGDETILMKLKRQHYKQLLYNDRLRDANKFIVHTKEEAKALSRLLYIRAEDIVLRTGVERDDNSVREMILSFLDDKECLMDYLKENNLNIVRNRKVTLLVDSIHYTITDVSGLGLDMDGFNLERTYESRNSIEDLTELLTATSILATFLGILGNIEQTPEYDERDFKKKKKKKKQLKL